jgi:hypothetical protein
LIFSRIGSGVPDGSSKTDDKNIRGLAIIIRPRGRDP